MVLFSCDSLVVILFSNICKTPSSNLLISLLSSSDTRQTIVKLSIVILIFETISKVFIYKFISFKLFIISKNWVLRIVTELSSKKESL